MNYKLQIANLLKYAISYSTPAIFTRGKKIMDNCKNILFSLDQQKAEYKAHGTSIYKVKIHSFLDEYSDIESSCTCPSEWSEICKHEVAAILDLIERLKHSKFVEGSKPTNTLKKTIAAPKSRKSTTPILLKGFETLTGRKVFDLSDLDEFRRTPTRYSTCLKVQRIGELVVEINESWWQVYDVRFFFQDSDIYSTCTCEVTTKGLCKHQIAVLSFFINQDKKDFLQAYNPSTFIAQKEKLATWAGIPITDFDKSFDYDFENQTFTPKGKISGLINFAQAKKKVQILPSNNLEWKVPEPVLTTEEEEIFSVGYILNVDYDVNSISTFTPIIGRKTNSALLKSLAHYSDSDYKPIQKTKLDKTIISLMNETETDYSYCQLFTLDEENKKNFQVYQQLIKHLAQAPYTYIRACKHSDKIRKKHISPITFSATPAKLFYELSENGSFISMRAKLQLGDETISILSSKLSKTLLSSFFVQHEQTIYIHESFTQAMATVEYVAKNPILKAKIEDTDLFFEQIANPTTDTLPVKLGRLKSLKKKEIILKPDCKQLFISDLGNFVIFEPVLVYDNDLIIKIFRKGDPFRKEEDTIHSFIRDPEVESEFLDYVSGLHPDFESQRQHDFFYLTYDQLLEKNWFFDFFENIKDEDIETFGVDALKRLKYSPHRASISTHIKSGLDWFDVEITLSFGEEQVKMSDLRKAVIQRSKFIRLKDGKLGLLPEEWLKKLESYFRLGTLQGDNLKVSKHKFTLIDSLFNDIDDEEILKELASKRKKIKSFKNIRSVPLSKKMTATLRPYQKEGLNWLQFLDDFKWGGILADDMGLGKTVQVLSLLQNLIDQKRRPNLVVVPTSLLFNWQNEFKKFAPKIKYHVHYGLDRIKDIKILKKYDVVLTTYGIMMRDIEMLKTQRFSYVILDESQAIKNVLSQRYKAACLLQAENRIAMTGTPIENNTFDLFAQMNFLNPGFFGTQAGFKRDYSKPIDTHQDAERAQELQKMISPFVLRRTKEQVAKELPPKIEDYIYVNLEPDQKKVYDAYRNKYRDYLLGKIEEDGLNKSKMYVLEGLTKLRLICDSPALIKDEEFLGESAKIKELISHITEKTANHKMLVFSQFTKMLALVKIELDKHGIAYEYLDGQRNQKQRKNSVENFQDNPKIRVFLLSLKAGNTGLNLTAADYVYLLDPWWNPAVESQAIDRTHRIGQDKHVIAYRMIAKDTIEEKIMKLQQRKKKLASDLIQTDESFMKRIQKEDIMDLFS